MSDFFGLFPIFQLSFRLKEFFMYLFLITPILYLTFLFGGPSILELWSYRYIHKQSEPKTFVLHKIVHYRKYILLLFRILSNSFLFTFILGLFFLLMESIRILPSEQEYSTKIAFIGIWHCIVYYCLAIVNQLLYLLSFVNQNCQFSKCFLIQQELTTRRYLWFKLVALFILPIALATFNYPFITNNNTIIILIIFAFWAYSFSSYTKYKENAPDKKKR
ncbi:hypothetical protein [Enterococcus cecorum]|uniref:hypothetical protein n=1 Tax=Enterococcus cecorum TaxID=44008 RepID=UPI00200AE781|nr:hypothetical protein [Enterococcus cecorum]